MLICTIFKKNDRICGFQIKNHTDPIVCSGVSALAQSTVNSIEALSEVGSRYELETDEESGYLYFFIPSHARGEVDKAAELFLKGFELGALNLSEGYSEYMTVKIREVSDYVKN